MRKLITSVALLLFVVADYAGARTIVQFSPRNEPDYGVSVYVKNVSGVDLARGSVVIWDTDARANFGVDVTTATSDNSTLFAGVLEEDVLDGNFGRLKIEGYFDGIRIAEDTGSISVGSILGADGTNAGCAKVTSTQGAGGIVAYEVKTSTTAPALIKGYIR